MLPIAIACTSDKSSPTNGNANTEPATGTGDMQGTCADNTSTESRFDTWEVAYNHYHNRMGLDLPQTARLIQTQIRPNAPRAVWNLVYETLTHAGL